MTPCVTSLLIGLGVCFMGKFISKRFNLPPSLYLTFSIVSFVLAFICHEDGRKALLKLFINFPFINNTILVYSVIGMCALSILFVFFINRKKSLFLKKGLPKNNHGNILNEFEEKNPTTIASQAIYALKAEFANRLSKDIAILKSSDNIQMDAHSILKGSFDKQHAIYIKLRNSLDAPDKDRFNDAWQIYYGEEDEQEWYLPNEYSTLLSSQLKNTSENTKQLAIGRIEKILRLCR